MEGDTGLIDIGLKGHSMFVLILESTINKKDMQYNTGIPAAFFKILKKSKIERKSIDCIVIQRHTVYLLYHISQYFSDIQRYTLTVKDFRDYQTP